MFKRITYFIVAILLTSSVFGQTEDSNDEVYFPEGDEYVLTSDSLKVKDKLHYGFTMGAGFGNSNTYGKYFSTYYSPLISYDVSPRFSINTGVTYVNSSVDNIPVLSEVGYQLFSGNISQYYAFLGGEYKLTEKLSVGGSVFYDFTSYKTHDGTSLDNGSGLDNLGYSGYLKYKVSKSLSIEAEIRINDKNPYRQQSNSFSNGFMGAETTIFGR